MIFHAGKKRVGKRKMITKRRNKYLESVVSEQRGVTFKGL